MAENASVKLPGHISPQLEAELALISELYRQTIKEYKLKKEITEKQKSNLTNEERIG